MPANLPPPYFEAEQVYRRARTPADKIAALGAMLAAMPKHKGTDHLRAQLRARIAALARDAERAPAGGARADLYSVPREGAGQVALVGPPNAGKSQLLAALTDAAPAVADYPFTTRLPQPGMMPVANVQVQLVNLPPLMAGATPLWQRALIRQADLALLVIGLADDPLGEWAMVRDELASLGIGLTPPGGSAEADADADVAPVLAITRALVVATKADTPGAAEALELLGLEVDGALPVLAVSGATGAGLEALRRRVLAALDVVRVYPKPPGKPPDRAKPFVLPRGSTVDDLAGAVHRDLRATLKHALLWGASGKFGGQRVGRQHVLEDEDVVELIGE